MAEAAPDPVNIAVIASAVCGSVVIIVTIIVIICVIGYCYERIRSAPDTRSRAENQTNHQPHHHNRRRRQRRRGHDQREEREGADPSEDVHLEDSELQPHPPPPSYNRVHQYSSIDVDLNIVTQRDDNENGTTRVSMFNIGDTEIVQDEDTITNQNEMIHQVGPPQRDTLPPTYSTAQMEARSSAGTLTEEGHINSGSAREESESTSQSRSAEGEGSLPPSYSTARMELMRIRAQNRQGLSNDGNS